MKAMIREKLAAYAHEAWSGWMKSKIQRLNYERTATIIAVVCIAVCFVFGVYFVYNYLPVDVDWQRGGPASVGVDWKGAFRPAVLDLLNGQSPYGRSFFNPPWALIPLVPVALLSPALGAAVMFVLNLFCYLLVAVRLRLHFVAIIVFLLFSGMVWNSFNGNIEGIAALGFILPPQIGLFFVLLKPQFGLAVAVFWAVEAWQKGGTKQVARTFLPVSVAFALSFILFGFWPASAPDLTGAWWNASIYPRGVPVGAALLVMALWRREIRFAVAASPFFAPYLTGHTWAVVWFGALALASQINIRPGVTLLAKRIFLWRRRYAP